MKVEIDGVEYVPKSIIGTSNAMPFGKLIRHTRKENNMTLEQVAKAINISKSHLCNLERGYSIPGLLLLDKILRFYGLSYYRIKLGKNGRHGGG